MKNYNNNIIIILNTIILNTIINAIIYRRKQTGDQHAIY